MGVLSGMARMPAAVGRRAFPAARTRGALVALGLLGDQLLGEVPAPVHPVALFGSAMQRMERVLWRDSVPAGVLYAALGTGAGVLGGAFGGSTAAVTWICSAQRCLAESASAVAAALGRGDLERARALLPALVGRDPEDLDSGEIARAVVESVAENTVDAVVAPALWAFAGGAAGAGGHRALNTLDSMVGHRSLRYGRFGRASARFDDVAAWVPARVTAALVVLVRPWRVARIVSAVRHQAPMHPSPNAGVAEAAFAAALGVRLGGVNRYPEGVRDGPVLGWGRPADWTDVERAVRLSGHVTAALAALLVFPWVAWLVARLVRSMTRPPGRAASDRDPTAGSGPGTERSPR